MKKYLMMIVIAGLGFSTSSFAKETSVGRLVKACSKKLAIEDKKRINQVCNCIGRNLSAKLKDEKDLAILADVYSGKLSPSKAVSKSPDFDALLEMDEDVAAHCLKNPKWTIKSTTF